MTASTSTSGSFSWLHALAVAQALGITALAVLVLRGDDAAPAPAPALAAERFAGTAPAPAHDAAPPAPPLVGAAAAPPATPAPGAAPAAPAPTADAGAGTVVFGRVADERGNVVPDGHLWFTRSDDGRQLATVSSGQADGVFALAGLAPGTITYRSRAQGFAPVAGTIEIPPGTARVRHDITIPSAWVLTIKLQTPDGTPLHEALQNAAKARPRLRDVDVAAVVTYAPPTGDFALTAHREVQAGAGRWHGATGIEARFRGRPQAPKDVSGTVDVDERRPVWVSAVLRHRIVATVAVPPEQNEVVLRIALDDVTRHLGTIRGRLVDAASGAPVTDARIGFGDLQSGGAGEKVGEDGRFAITDLRPGLLDIEARGSKLAALHDLVLLQPGEVLDLGDVPMFTFRTIRGRCDGATGELANARFACWPLSAVPHPALRRGEIWGSVQADGSFKLSVPDGRYLLRVYGAGGAVLEFDSATLGDQPLVVPLATEAPLRLDVAGGGECEIAVFDASNRALYRRSMQGGVQFALPLVPGDYRVEATGADGQVRRHQVALGAAGADLRLP